MIKVLELIDGGFLGGGQTHILSLVKCIDKNKFDTVEITKAKLTLVIEAAKESGNKLRILVPNEGKLKASVEPKWKGVLEKMGFSGSAEFVTYEELKRTTDA